MSGALEVRIGATAKTARKRMAAMQMPPEPTSAPPSSAAGRSWLIPILLLGLAIRLPILFTDFWVDEVWSYNTIMPAGGLAELFSILRHNANSHPLNSLWIYLVGPTDQWWVYRLPSLVCGLALIAAMGRLASRHGARAGNVVAVMAALSYPLAHHATEARGYSIAMLCAVLAFLTDGREAGPRRRALVQLWLALGLLGHFVILFAAVGIGLRQVQWALQSGDRVRGGLRLLRDQGPIAVFVLTMLYLFLSDTAILGGPEWPLHQVLMLALASPFTGGALPLGWFGAIAGVALFLRGWMRLRQAEAGLTAFVLGGFVLAPVLVLTLLQPEVVYERYFAALWPFLIWLVGVGLVDAWQARGWRVLALVFVFIAILGTTYSYTQLAIWGRGNYRATLEHILERTPGEVVVGGNNEEPVEHLVTFYARLLPEGDRLHYAKKSRWPRKGVDWLVFYSEGFPWTPEAKREWRYLDGKQYVYDSMWPTAYPTHMYWWLYRRADAAAGAPTQPAGKKPSQSASD